MENEALRAMGKNVNLNFAIAIATFLIAGLWMVSIYSSIVFMFGMLPGLIAIVVDPEPDQFAAKIVSTFNLMGVAFYESQIIHNLGMPSFGLNIALDPITWLMIYGAAAFGWLIYWIFPQFTFILINLRAQTKLLKLNSELNNLTAEWGEEIKSNINKAVKK
jgi:ABC-type enterochelin transport system permease subunit